METYSFFADRTLNHYNKNDTLFVVSVLLLWGLGMFTLYVVSATNGARFFNDPLYFTKRQLVSSVVGFIVFGVMSVLNIQLIRKSLPYIVLGTLILSFLTVVPGIGVNRNGASRWIRLPFFTFQPSEAVKFSIILFLANLFDKQAAIQRKEDRSSVPAAVGLIIFVGVILLLQKDFSTSVFIFGVGVILFIVSGSRIMWLIPFSLLALPASFLMVTLEPYRMNRVIAFLRPEEDMQGINYQNFSARRAINAGGFWGEGIGSELTKLKSIPEVQADYIFAGWVEAMGFIGVIIFFLLLFFFAWRAFRIALTVGDRFTALSVFGFASMIVLQSVANCAVVCGAIPSTGIPLPFFSSGGSSIIMTLAMCGFILNASRYNLENSIMAESIEGVSLYE